MTELPLWTAKYASHRDVSMNTTATAVVIFPSRVPGPELPKSVWLEPPKAAPMLAPLPRWSSTMMIRKIQTMTWIMLIKICNVQTPSFQ
jgi:hypothetical protein